MRYFRHNKSVRHKNYHLCRVDILTSLFRPKSLFLRLLGRWRLLLFALSLRHVLTISTVWFFVYHWACDDCLCAYLVSGNSTLSQSLNLRSRRIKGLGGGGGREYGQKTPKHTGFFWPNSLPPPPPPPLYKPVTQSILSVNMTAKMAWWTGNFAN